ncbi:IS4 family transposase [Enterobacter sp. RHBSTW-00994]|uniref:IS4 family transposase n=1 Tax=Enterobacter sp. RHBSTW-00994 TaxID=2742676 RepID=UPI0015E9C76C|nr:IS4 family transposase [Enterobacter sp. RHBSTW-00994]QLR44052.1 IS4 family transposase [Enterobacter sp. RHBSTW-00994]
MELYQAPGIINATTPERARSLADLIPPALIQQALTLTDTVTLRKRKLPLGSMIWLVVGMSIFCDRPMTEIVNLMDITDRTGPPFTARSAVIQRRKTLGENAVRELFDITRQYWNQQAVHPQWHGLNLFAVDGVVRRTADTPENRAAFSKHTSQYGEGGYPQVRMVCLMALSSHLITACAFDSENISEMRLAEQLTEKAPDNSITLFDKGFYPMGLLHHWQTSGENRHWLLPLKKNTQYRVVRRLGRGDELVCLKTSPRARKHWPGGPEEIVGRLLTRRVDGKERQELWGGLLAYKLVQYQMVQMVFHLKGDDLPNQLSFSGAISEIIRLLITQPWASPGKMPGEMRTLYEQAKWLILPGRRERSYPRELRVKTRKYPDKKVAGHLK